MKMQPPYLSYKQRPVGRTSVRHCSTKVEPTTFRNSLQSGFTLLEMVLVLFLVGLMASATLMLTEGVEDQAKYDETKRRMEIMRKAIVGDPTRTVNGGPEISGFVADMGRLPLCVAELLTAGDSSDAAATPPTFESPCDASEEIPAWNIDTSTGLGVGWRGPYIQVIPERDKDGDGEPDIRFRDGYGNTDSSTAIDAQNSGWIYDDASIAIGQIGLVSDGFDLTSSTDDMKVNPLIFSADWQIQLSDPLSINFVNLSSGNLPLPNAEKLVLRIYKSDLTAFISGDDGTINNYLDVASGAIPANSQQVIQFIISSTQLPIGYYGYSVVCHEVPATGNPEDYVIFDGDCDTTNNVQTSSTIRTFSVAPRQNITLDWIIQ